MNNMIDLTPYISGEYVVLPKKAPKKRIDLAALAESVVTVLLGVGIFFVLAAFFAAI